MFDNLSGIYLASLDMMPLTHAQNFSLWFKIIMMYIVDKSMHILFSRPESDEKYKVIVLVKKYII